MDITSGRTLYSIFKEFVTLQPDKEWLLYERADGQIFRWTYSEFLDTVHQAANLLQELGIGEGDVFNIHLYNHPAYPQLILAASYLGAVVMPSNPSSTYDELHYLVEHSESKVIFTQNVCLETAQQMGIDKILVCQMDEHPAQGVDYETALARQSITPPTYHGDSEKLVQILYTSGTTSRPKGVMMTNANIIYAVESLRTAIGIRAEDRHLIVLPMFHGGAQIHALWVSMISGASVVVLPRFSASRFFEQAIHYEATLAALFAAALRMLLNQPERPADSTHNLRNVTFAQNLTQTQYDAWHQRFKVPLQQLWGLTEAISLPVVSPLTGRRNLLAMGRPVMGYELRVVDENDQEVPPGEPGQLIVRGVPGRSLMHGYLKNPEATAEALHQHVDGIWLYTGDTVYRDAEGFIYFMDRGKDLIKRAGERISSMEIESVIHHLSGVQDVCVVSVPDTMRDEAIIAVIISQQGSSLTEQMVIDYCKAHLSAFKIPQRVIFVDEYPRTSVGKVQKNLVRQQLLLEETRNS